jgi:hypothetical protein
MKINLKGHMAKIVKISYDKFLHKVPRIISKRRNSEDHQLS